MKTQRTVEERIWDYIDGNASEEEKSVISKLLESDAEWKSKYGELLDLNNLIRSTELEAPSMRFTKNVMEEISRLQIAPATRTYLNKRIIWGLGIFFIAIFVSVLLYGFGQTDWSGGTETSFTDKLSRIDIGKFFNNTWINGFMMVNVVLGLFLVDSYLNQKRKEFRKEI